MTLERKLLALMLGTVPFAAKELDKGLEQLRKVLEECLAPKKQMSYGDFLDNPGGPPLINLAAEHTQAEGFAAIARRGGVDVSVKRDQTEGTYYLVLHGRHEDIIKAVKTYQTKQQLEPQRSRSLTAELGRKRAGAPVHEAVQERSPLQRNGR